MADRLQEIKDRLNGYGFPPGKDTSWLIAEVERLRELEVHQNEAIAQGMRMWVKANERAEKAEAALAAVPSAPKGPQ